MQSLFKKVAVRQKSSDSNHSKNGRVELLEAYEIFKNVPMEIAVYDLEGRYKFINENYCPNEYGRDTLIGKDDSVYFAMMGISPESGNKRKTHFERALTEKTTVKFTEKLYIPDKKKTLYYKRYYQPIFADKDQKKITCICLFGTNLSSTILGQKELKYQAYHDMLTGLKNRYAFYEVVNQIILDAERDTDENITAVLYCDLDNFKVINDSFGHDIGDKVLKEVSSRINICVRKTDSVFRVGGDEFSIIIKNIHQDYDAGKIAEKIIQYVADPYYISGHKITFLSISIGIVLFPMDGIVNELLIQNADTAMYNAKKKGKNNFQFFSRNMTEQLLRKLNIEKALRRISNEADFSSQFEILFQPIVEKISKNSYKTIGSEALVRWKHPELGVVHPDLFIPIAEQSNLISTIGEWILYKACRDFKEIISRHSDRLYVSVNFSAKQLQATNMIRKIEKMMRVLDVDPGMVQIELTETSYMDNHVEVLRNLNELSTLGFRLAIDDFGTGYASLVYLQKFTAQTIKIDKSFIKHISTNPKHMELVNSIIKLGLDLNKDVIAEGIEQLEDLYLLESQNCAKFQGFLFSPPLTLSAFEKYLQKENLLSTVFS